MCKNIGKIKEHAPIEHFSQIRQETKENGKPEVFQSWYS